MKKTFYVTTPIYYPSGNLHIGHVYTTTLAWTLRNFKRLDGYDTKFLTGSDEHGQKIELKAKENNLSPQDYVDKMYFKINELWKKFHIDFDYFSRTSSKKHELAIQKQFIELKEKGFIYKDKYKGLYSIQDEEFLTKTQAVKKDGKFYHPTSKHELEVVEEESYFLKISEFTSWLKNYFKSNSSFINQEKIKNELLNNFIDKGLTDLSISRNTFNWGVPVPGDEKNVIYVWLDALNNYITALGYNSSQNTDFKKYWSDGSEIVHIVGKEITRFHCIYWPIILKMANLRQPTTILPHGWIINEDGKMSKSKGNVVDPLELIKKYGHEQIKYYFASQINIGDDSVFSENHLKDVINSELVNNYGNLVSRTIAMTNQNFKNSVKYTKTINTLDIDLYESIVEQVKEYKKHYNNYEVNKAIQSAIMLSKKLNKYIDLTEPWKLKEDKPKLEIILNNLLNGIYAVTTMLSTIIPETTENVRSQLDIDKLSFEHINNFSKFDSSKPVKGDVIFERIK